jgi:lipopolysaccharide export system permease protein
MKIITKYLVTTIFTYVALVLLFLLGLQIFIEFLYEFPNLGLGNYNLYRLIIQVLLMLPFDIYQFFPGACLLGFIIALGLLAAHNELVVLRTAGVSIAGIAKTLWLVVGILAVVMVILGEVISPLAQSKAYRLKTAAISGGQVLLTRQGAWLYSKDNVTNIANIDNHGKIYGVINYQLGNNAKLQSISYAPYGSYQNGRWILTKVVKTIFKDRHTFSSTISREPSTITFSPKLIGVTKMDSEQKSLPALYSYIKYRHQAGVEVASYLFSFWQRILAPFTLFIMLLLAVPIVFGFTRSTTIGFKMLLGTMFGFGFYILYQFVGPMSIVHDIPPFLASSIPLVVFTIIGIVLLSRVH